jgi:hypothetical protein
MFCFLPKHGNIEPNEDRVKNVENSWFANDEKLASFTLSMINLYPTNVENWARS